MKSVNILMLSFLCSSIFSSWSMQLPGNLIRAVKKHLTSSEEDNAPKDSASKDTSQIAVPKHLKGLSDAQLSAYIKDREVDIAQKQGETILAMEAMRKDLDAKLLAQQAEISRNMATFEDGLARKRNEAFVESLHASPSEVRMDSGWIRSLSAGLSGALDDARKNQTKDHRKVMQEQVELQGKMLQEAVAAKSKADLAALPAQLHLATHMEKLKHKHAMERVTAYTKTFMDFAKDPERLAYTAAFIGGTALFIYAARHGTRVTADFMAAHLAKPKLLTATSRFSLTERLNPGTWAALAAFKKRYAQSSLKNDVILHPALQLSVLAFAQALKNARKFGGILPNALFYGPPGTGKTLCAETIAAQAGMDYGITSATNFAQLPEAEAIQALNRLMDWAHANKKKGTLLFLDEAEELLGDRENEHMSERSRKLLTAFLARSGTESKNLALIFATNRPSALDPAAMDRTDTKLEFKLPGFEQRKQLFKLKMQQWLTSMKISIEGFSDTEENNAKIEEIAHATAGFSGREISKLVIALQSRAFVENNHITLNGLDAMVAEKVVQHHNMLKFKKPRASYVVQTESSDFGTAASDRTPDNTQHVATQTMAEFPLPVLEERKKIIRSYIEEQVISKNVSIEGFPTSANKLDFSDARIEILAQATSDFSKPEIFKLLIELQGYIDNYHISAKAWNNFADELAHRDRA